MKLTALLLGVAAAGLLLLGLVLGFAVGVTDERGYDCGTAFVESDDLLSDQLLDTFEGGTGDTGCDAARGSRRVLPVTLLGLGTTAAAAASIVAVNARERPKSADVP